MLCFLILCWFIISAILVDSLGFSVYNIRSFANSGNLTFFFSNLDSLFFYLLNSVIKNFKTILKNSRKTVDKSGNFCLKVDLQFFTFEYNVSCGLVVSSHYINFELCSFEPYLLLF